MSAYSVGSMMFDDQLSRVEKVARELKDNAWALRSAAATDASKLLVKADRTAHRVSTALLVSAVVTAVSTIAIVRTARGHR